jgi:hypothetical protein
VDPATISSWLTLIAQVISLLIQAGASVIDMMPYVTMFFKIVNGTPLTPEEEADLNAKHAALTAAALAPLPAPPEDAT